MGNRRELNMYVSNTLATDIVRVGQRRYGRDWAVVFSDKPETYKPRFKTHFTKHG